MMNISSESHLRFINASSRASYAAEDDAENRPRQITTTLKEIFAMTLYVGVVATSLAETWSIELRKIVSKSCS